MVKENESPTSALGKHLAVLSSDIRLQILRILYETQYPVEFNEIHKTLQSHFSEFVNTSYHLKRLKNMDLIIGDDRGYQLTDIGSRAFRKLVDLEDIISTDRVIYVRTSKYSLEPFDESIIESNLQLEANMTAKQAQTIAQEARKRLKKANITYLTTPLIREYINAILIENQYEDYRHKLTRLGLPPYDINQIIFSEQKMDPEILRLDFGTTILEQYVLLNQMRQKFADDLLSGRFVLTDLEHYGISPLELLLPGTQFTHILYAYYLTTFTENEIQSIFDLPFQDFLFNLTRFLEQISPFFPKGLTIIRFDEFVSQFLNYYTPQELTYLIKFGFFVKQNISKWPIMLGISLKANLIEVEALLQAYSEISKIQQNNPFPKIQIHHGHTKFKALTNTSDFTDLKPVYQQIIQLMQKQSLILNQFSQWGKPNTEHIFTNLKIPISFESMEGLKPSIVLEKISINVLKIYLEHGTDEKQFFSELEKSVFHIFDYFELKSKILKKNLVHFPGWQSINTWIFNQKDPFVGWKDHQKYASHTPLICGVSCHGLDELIYLKTGLFIREQSQNRKIASDIIQFINSLLEKQNDHLNCEIRYVFSQLHCQKELERPTNHILDQYKEKLSDQPEEIKDGYRYGYCDTQKIISNDNFNQIYADLVELKNQFILIQKSNQFLSKEQTDKEFYLTLKNILSTEICGIDGSDIQKMGLQ